jgi:hypothetical protein
LQFNRSETHTSFSQSVSPDQLGKQEETEARSPSTAGETREYVFFLKHPFREQGRGREIEEKVEVTISCITLSENVTVVLRLEERGST